MSAQVTDARGGEGRTGDRDTVREALDAALNILDRIVQHRDAVGSDEDVAVRQEPQDREQVAVQL